MTFEPMLAIASTGASGRDPYTIRQLLGSHMFDLKLDGIRCYAEGGRLRNRHGVDITHKYPEIVDALANSAAYGRLDGELVATDGRFETALTRDKQEKKASILRASVAHPMLFVVFDMPTDNLIPKPWWRRREALTSWEAKGIDPRVSLSPCSHEEDFFERTREMGMEGVIAKAANARYVTTGKRSSHWIKFKHTHRVTCLVRGYRPGSGSRSHFGNMQLVLIEPDGSFRDVGDVGTGWTDRQTHELKGLLDRGEILAVEIECLNVTSGGSLRFPVYKGIRTDVAPIECTTAQLDTIPSSASAGWVRS